MLKDVLIQRGLSNREAEVAELVTQGLSNREVASQLFVTEKTVKFHLTNIYKKMSVKSRAQLIVWCLPHMDFIEREVQDTRVVNVTSPSVPTNSGPIIDQVGEEPAGGEASNNVPPTLSTGWSGTNGGKDGKGGF